MVVNPLVTVAALPEMLIPQVPLAPEPVVDGAPIVLYDTVIAAPPLYVLPDTMPVPLLLKVTAFVTDPAEVADVALVAVAALPEMSMFHVPVAFKPATDGAPTVL